MQQSGELLLAAGLDGGNTMILACGENATNPIIHPRKDTRLDTISSLVFLLSEAPGYAGEYMKSSTYA